MYNKKYSSLRLFIFGILLFLSGIVTNVIATTVVDSSTETRANAIWDVIRSNTSKMNASDATSYYQLVRLNIKTLIEVLSMVDEKINQELSSVGLPTDIEIIDEITNTGTKNPTPTCAGLVPTGEGIIKSTSVYGMAGSDTWSYVANTKGNSTDLGMSCQWTCAPGYNRVENKCSKSIATNSCKWQYHAVFGPVGDMTVNPNTTECTTAINGTNAIELAGNRQTVATCACPTTVSTSGTTPTCAGLAPTGEGIIKSTSVYGMVGSDTWSYVPNSKGNSTDLGMSCQWTCAPGYTKNENTCIKGSAESTDPKTVYTDRSMNTIKNTFTIGETLYGYISGGDKNNLWGCIDVPGGNDCKNNKGWRQLTKSYYDPITAKVIEDGWQSNPNRNGRVELQQGLYISEGYPTGTYTGYTRTGLTGKMVSATFTVVAKAKSCSWGATYGPCNPGTCSVSNIGAQACGGICACN